MVKRNMFVEFVDFMSNNGLASSLMCSIIVLVIPVISRHTLAKWIGEIWATVTVLAFVAVCMGFCFACYRRRERARAQQCGFEFVTPETYHLDGFVDVEECPDEDNGKVTPRKGLLNEIAQWCHPAEGNKDTTASSRVCIVTGGGRISAVLHLLAQAHGEQSMVGAH